MTKHTVHQNIANVIFKKTYKTVNIDEEIMKKRTPNTFLKLLTGKKLLTSLNLPDLTKQR